QKPLRLIRGCSSFSMDFIQLNQKISTP
ncbi:unnamed protein product, partial [Allacma fusca]